MMNFTDLVKKTRSIRRFKEDEKLDQSLLEELVNTARLTPSAMNLQPLKYFISNNKKTNSTIFSSLKWAGYLKNWNGPKPGQRPAAYILICGDRTISKNIKWDMSIAAYSIMLAAAEKNIGGCILASMDHKELHKDLNLSDNLEILITCALGASAENIIIDEAAADIKYYRDEKDNHHVPKRSLKEILIK
jgi:nitroreductase